MRPSNGVAENLTSVARNAFALISSRLQCRRENAMPCASRRGAMSAAKAPGTTYPPSGAVAEIATLTRSGSGTRQVCRVRKLEPVAPASADQLGQARDGVAHHAHAVGVVLPGVRFDQHRKAIALWKIACREARRIHGQRKPRGRVIG